MPRALRLVLGDQLTRDVSALDGLDDAADVVLMLEVAGEATYVPHHKQKIILVLAAMRHFAATLRGRGICVDYVTLDDPDNSGALTSEVLRAIERHRPERLILTEPGEWRVLEMMRAWQSESGVKVEIRQDTRFLCSREEFARWANGRTQWRMEWFYREMRRKTGWLMAGNRPEGGQWNFDAENRKPLPHDAQFKPPLHFPPDAITRDVIALVQQHFPHHFGDAEPFRWAVNRSQALLALKHFIQYRLPLFGDFQDAMTVRDDFVYHALLSPYLNLGLLTAREVCEAALQAYAAGQVPLNAVEGFIRQIIGWREYVRGLYWHQMPGYASTNALEAHRPLPAFFWTGETDMHCMKQCIDASWRNAYAHHIQRLMVTGNFALLAGIEPAQIEAWYLAVYADAYDWVELPNTHGMVLFADGGLLASKPYAASGAYIRRMSDYCGSCRYDPDLKSGPDACPFNYLYWHFLLRHRERLGQNPRMAMPYRTLTSFEPTRIRMIEADSHRFLDALAPWTPHSTPDNS